ncbi:glutathione S-transferase [Aspergillus steynii IBT 23096]|uniref:Glutathione S-transferase n=1 Tax=Aspergillus steynii IBT 23096 TaxID=1392250 RepID=A0A2I2FZ27_9EURO|nr:glutathione S-transferase [Aspergillus steynii IBT 23096]PLB45875.1 glutathione S-transferase [Aspergillus steynii IBT 23096]
MSSPNIDLYTAGTANGFKVSILLEELGLPYKTHALDLGANQQKEEWFLKINPNGRIPAITDGETRVFESAAILLYLADKYDTERKFSYAPGTAEYAEQLSWLMWQMGGLGPMQGQANHFAAFATVRSDYGIQRYTDETKRLYSVLELRLQESPYLAGDKLTIADLASYPWVMAGPLVLDLDLAEWPALKKWSDSIAEREAVQKGLKIPPPRVPLDQMAEFLAGKKREILARENTDKH